MAQARKKTTEKSKGKSSHARQGRSARKAVTVHVISDSTGSLASHMLNAVVTQFPNVHFEKIYHIFQHGKHDIQEILKKVSERDLVFYSLLDQRSKQVAHEACVKKRIPHYDLMGGLSRFVSEHVGYMPMNDVSLLHPMDDDYFRRIEAMEYTSRHDDSRGLDSIGLADVIIVGLSRVSKSPTSTYLGSLGYKVANVSLSTETGFPQQLNTRVKKKVVALTVQPKKLHDIRTKRLSRIKQQVKQAGAGAIDYDDLPSIVREVSRFEKEYRERGYPILDITERTVEETAAEVLKLLGIRKGDELFT